MKIKRICGSCLKDFEAQKEKQLYCSRKCFKKEYYHKLRVDTVIAFPIYKCPNCAGSTQLGFDPTKSPIIWKYFKCPRCTVDTEKIVEIFINSTEVFVLF